MRKSFILLGMMVTGLALSQTTGSVGVNTDTPQATLDIKPSLANAVATAVSNEGILIPRVTRERLEAVASGNLVESTLVYVTDYSLGITPTTTKGVLSKGFYYYSPVTNQWIRISDIHNQDLRMVGSNNHITMDAGNSGDGTNAGTGTDNVAVGRDALFSISSGMSNIGIGRNTLAKTTGGNYNTAIGYESLHNNTMGSHNIAFGLGALYANTTGVRNTAFGYHSLYGNTQGNDNISMGTEALKVNTIGNANVALGNTSLRNNTTGSNNLGIGSYSLRTNSTGSSNTAIGHNAMYRNTTGSYNIAQGYQSLYNNTTGNDNTSIGYNSGDWIKGNSNIHIGSSLFRDSNATELDNVVVIGNGINATDLNATTSQDNTIILGHKNGHNNTPNIGVGTYKPDSKVHIVANGPNAIKIVDTNQGAGKVLTSDANGVGTWKDIELFKGAHSIGTFNWASGTALTNNAWNKVATVWVKPGTNMVFVKLHILSSRNPAQAPLDPNRVHTRVYVGIKDIGSNNTNVAETPIYTMFHPYLASDYELNGSFIYNNTTNNYQLLYLNLQSDVIGVQRSAFEYNTSSAKVLGATWYENWFYSIPVN